MENSLADFSPNSLKEEGQRGYASSPKEEILLKHEDELKIVKKKKKKKKKKERKEKDEQEQEENILLFENDEIVEYTPQYVKNNNKHIVLAEEEYINILEKIIERNYFPDITKYKTELLLEEKGKVDKEELRRCHIDSNDFTSPGGNTFMDFVSECDSIRNKKNKNSVDLYKNNENLLALCDSNPFYFDQKKKEYQLVLLPNGKEHKINLNISLKEFQNKYTSEDNKSFDCLLNKMKNKEMEKNVHSMEKRKKHNMMMEKVEEYTKKGINCHMLHTNKADKEELMVKFSSDHRISDIVEVKKHKVHVNSSSTRFSKDDNQDIEKQVEGAKEIKQIRFLKKINEDKTEKMIEQGKFHLLKENKGYDYIRTPLSEEGKDLDYSLNVKGRKHVNSSRLDSSYSGSDDDSNREESSIYKKRRKYDTGEEKKEKKEKEGKKKEDEEDEDEEEEDGHKSEFNLQMPSKRELAADLLQNSVKNVKYNKQALRTKYLNSVINKRFSSKMSTTSFKHSVLSKYSQKRLNELAQKSSLASQLLIKRSSRL